MLFDRLHVTKVKSNIEQGGERMRSFYHFMMTFRGKLVPDDKSRLADWMFEDSNFPKQSYSYDEISRYLEWNIPFSSALSIFDELWEQYQMEEVM